MNGLLKLCLFVEILNLSFIKLKVQFDHQVKILEPTKVYCVLANCFCLLFVFRL